MSDETAEPEGFDLRSHDIAADKVAELLRLFPEIRTEGGKLDFDRLKRVLGETVDPGKERYGLNWPGKADCFKAIQTPSMGTLLPCPEESVNFDTSENLIIEGDNLEVLKLLQKSYLGKVKMIYIDPPYNTGNDFIYPDNYSESLQTYLEYTGQVDDEGKKFSTNSDTDGRYHSNWLNMMHPRLSVARSLLADDGVIFISIDDKELSNLLRLCDELLGEENRVGIVCWKNVTDNNPTLITPDNEFVLCYAKQRDAQPQAWSSHVSTAKETLENEHRRLRAQGLPLEEVQRRLRDFIGDNEESVGLLSRYKWVDEDGVYTGSESVHNPRPGGYDFEVFHPETGKPMRKPANGYRFPEATFREMEQSGAILYGQDENRIVKIKKYVHDYEDALRSVIVLDGRLGSYDVKRLFPETDALFTNPKPVALLETLASFGASKDSLFLDFFAGSGTTGEAVFRLNERDGGRRRFILVQLPEPTRTRRGDSWVESAAWRAGFKTISQLTRERVRRAARALAPANDGQFSLGEAGQPPTGFRAFKLTSSNLATWDPGPPGDGEELANQIEIHVSHIRQGRTELDILYEILLKSGYPLTVPVETLMVAGKTVYGVAERALAVCLDQHLSVDLVRAVADRSPAQVVCLDAGFAGNDQLKANAAQIFKSKGIVFRTI